jgi:beta-phosphoglucomutase-like phosphatase (HAD superfamily)
MVIEDSLTSIRLAKQNGAGCIIAAGETAPASELEGLADHIMADFTEFDLAWLVRKDPVTY